jgi:hypothetical protein
MSRTRKRRSNFRVRSFAWNELLLTESMRNQLMETESSFIWWLSPPSQKAYWKTLISVHLIRIHLLTAQDRLNRYFIPF